MSDIYDKGQDTLEQIAGNIIDVETELGRTNELLSKILSLLENPADRKVVHINVNFEATSDSPRIVARWIKEFKEFGANGKD